MPIPFLSSINLTKNEVENFKIYNLANDPGTLTSGGDFGYFWLNTTNSGGVIPTLKWWDGTNVRSLVDSTNISSFTAGLASDLVGGSAGQVVYQQGNNSTNFVSIGTVGQVLSSNATSAPSWLDQSSLSVGSATNKTGGNLGDILVQVGTGTTGFLNVGTAGQVITSNGASPQYVNQSTLSVGSATTAGSVVNALTAGAYLTSTGTFDGSVARTFAVDATDANTASKVVARDASGNFAAGTITAAKVTGLSAPTAGSDAANRDYVDSVAQGLDVKASCLVASTADINLASPGAITIDGVSSATDFTIGTTRILVKDQGAPAENGIYIWQGPSSAMTRSADADTWDKLVGAFTFIERGTANADSGWVCTSNAGGTLGSTAVTFVKFSQAGSYTAGNGIVQSGTSFNFAQSTPYTAGQIPFASSTTAMGFSANLNWDNANNRLGIGTASPGTTVDVALPGSGTPRLRVLSSSDDPIIESQRWSGTGSLYLGTRLVHSGGFFFQTAPSAAVGSQTFTTRLTVASDGVCTWSNVGGVAGTRMTLNATGLGVGVSPTVPLDIVGAGKISGALTVEGQNVNSAIRSAAENYAGVNFDGATTGTRVTSTLTGQAIGTGDFSIWCRFKVSSTVGRTPFSLIEDGTNYFALVSSSSNYTLDKTIGGTTTSGAITGFSGSAFLGQVVDFVLVRTAGAFSVYVNGTQYTIANTTGNISLSAAANLRVGGYFVASQVYDQPVYRAAIFNRALSAADIADLIANGINPADQWGTQTAIVSGSTGNGNFETWTTVGTAGVSNGVATSWNISNTGAGNTITRNDVSPISGTYDALMTMGATSGNVYFTQATDTFFAGKRYRLTTSAKRLSGSGLLRLQQAGTNTIIKDIQLVTGSVVSDVTEFVSNSPKTLWLLYTVNTTAQVDDVAIERIGAIVDLDFTVGLGDQAYDRSTNNLHGTLTGGVSWTVPKEEPVPFIDGTAAIPAITNAGDTNTGLYFPAADTVAATTNGVERLRIDSAGQVGIGVTPSAWSSSYRSLQVGRAFTIFANTGSNDSVLTNNAFWDGSNYKFIQNGWATRVVSDTSGNTQWGVSTVSGTAGNNVSWNNPMALTATGRLGLGTTNPTYQLHVNGTDTTVALINGATKGVRVAFTSGQSLIEGVDNTGAISYQPLRIGGSELLLVTSAFERLRIKSTGQVNFVGLASDPAGAAGDVVYNSTSNRLKYHNGTAWVDSGTRKYVVQLSDGSVTVVGNAYTLTHNFGTQDVTVSIRRTTDNAVVQADVVMPAGGNTVTVTFAAAITAAQFYVTVIG